MQAFLARRVAAALVLVVAGAAVPVRAGAAGGDDAGVPRGPRGERFYDVPDPLPKAKPGTLIRARPIDAGPDGAQTWRVLYHSRSVAGKDIAVSGLIVVPDGPAPEGGRPVVAWAHGTTGLADACAPSKFAGRTLGAFPSAAGLLAAGDVIAATDYEGLGTPGLHPYLVGESEGRNVLDAARAARELPSARAGRDLLVAGHSQGGHAALFAGELAATYAPELRLRGVAAVAPAADLDVILPGAARVSAALGFAVMILEGMRAAYPKADPADVLSPEGAEQARIVDSACGGEVIRTFAATDATAIVTGDVRVTEPIAGLAHRNSAGNRPAGAPVLVAQGDRDLVVIKPLTDAWVQKACGIGDSLDYRVYPGAGHGPVIFAAADDLTAWLADRLDGDAARSTC